MSAGGWGMGRTVFTLRWRENALRLIGFDVQNTQRNSGETSSLSIRARAGTPRETLDRVAADCVDLIAGGPGRGA